MDSSRPPRIINDTRPVMSELELLWRCLRCGEQWPDRGEALPERCPGCGAPKTEFERVRED